VRLLVQPRRELRQADLVEDFADPVGAKARVFAGIDDGGPIGKYGRCGSIIRDALAGISITPSPNGQMPEMARNSVDLPAPDGPVTSVRSPGRRLKLSAATSGAPFGSLTRSCGKVISLLGVATLWTEAGSAASLSALLIELSKPSRRATTARHSAMVR
jgi:hypothetical protein